MPGRTGSRQFFAERIPSTVGRVQRRSGSPELTRRQIFKALNDVELFGELPIVEQLSRIWPLPEVRGAGFAANLEKSVMRHCVNNDDWTNAELLEVMAYWAAPDNCSSNCLRQSSPRMPAEERSGRSALTH